MEKKVIDIFPPQEKEKEEKEVIFLPEDNDISFEERSTEKKEKKKKIHFLNKKTISLFIIFSFLFLIFGSTFFKKVTIQIWPKLDSLHFSQKITIDAKREESDFSNGILAGKLLEKEEIFNEDISATGKFLKKAEGTIRLYNAYTTQNEVWRKGTRFVSSEGKLFLSKDKINVPGARIKNGKLVPSHVDVPVIAAEGGESYNIGPSKFSVFVYRGTPRYTKFYGESFKPMTGGGEMSQVTEDDLKKAKEILKEKAKKEALSSLQKSLPSGYRILDQGIDIKTLEEKSEAKPGDLKEKFNYQIKAKISAIAFKEKEIDDFIFSFVSKRLPEGKKIENQSLKKEYKSEFLDLEQKRFSLLLSFWLKIYDQLDLNALKKSLAGKNLDTAKLFLQDMKGIEKAEFHLSPFWAKTLPKDIKDIKLQLKID